MPRYTHARLAYALQVFRESAPYRNKHGFRTENLERHLRRDGLRSPATTMAVARVSVWHDKDDSGDYDPSSANRRQAEPVPPKPRAPKRKAGTLGDDGGRGRIGKRAKWQLGRMNGDSCKITLKLTSEAGKTLLLKLGDGRVPASRDDHRPDTGDEMPSLWERGGGSFSRYPRSSLSIRRHALLGDDVHADDGNEDIMSRGLGLRGRVIPDKKESEQAEKLVRCLPCRLAKKRCAKKSTGPCTLCRKVGANCVPDFLDGRDGKEESEVTLPGSRCEDPITINPPTKKVNAPKGVVADAPTNNIAGTKWITTQWAHPMNFKLNSAREPDKICHFCSDYRYGIIGYGEVQIEVIVDGSGYVEMGGGHREAGIESTNMCISCAFERFAIGRCIGHKIHPIAGASQEGFDFQAAMTHLCDPSTATREPKARNHCCRFCPAPAFCACGAPQEYDILGRPMAPGANIAPGCGLTLCPSCATHLEECGWDYSELKAAVKRRGYRVRADMEFLFPHSDLHRAYLPISPA